MAAVSFADFRAEDALAIDVQPSQWRQGGIDTRELMPATARMLEGAGAAWTARAADGRVLCCAGLAEQFPGVQSFAWSILADRLGVRQHLEITRFARARIMRSAHRRIECVVEADPAGRCRKWAEAVGLSLRATVPCWGADSRTVLLMDRVREQG